MNFLDRIMTAMDRTAVPSKAPTRPEGDNPNPLKEIRMDRVPPVANLSCSNDACPSRQEKDDDGFVINQRKVAAVESNGHFVCQECSTPIWTEKSILCHNKKHGPSKPTITPVWNEETARFECPGCHEKQTEKLPDRAQSTPMDDPKPPDSNDTAFCMNCNKSQHFTWKDKRATNLVKNIGSKNPKDIKDVNVSRWVPVCPNGHIIDMQPWVTSKKILAPKSGKNFVDNYNRIIKIMSSDLGMSEEELKRLYPLASPDLGGLQHSVVSYGMPSTTYIGGTKATYDRHKLLCDWTRKVPIMHDVQVQMLNKTTGKLEYVTRSVPSEDEKYQHAETYDEYELKEFEQEKRKLEGVRKVVRYPQALRVHGNIGVRIAQPQVMKADDDRLAFFTQCKKIVEFNDRLRLVSMQLEKTSDDDKRADYTKQINNITTQRIAALDVLRKCSEYSFMYNDLKKQYGATPDIIDTAIVALGDDGRTGNADGTSTFLYGRQGYDMTKGTRPYEYVLKVDERFPMPIPFHVNALDGPEPVALDPSVLARYDSMMSGVLTKYLGNPELVDDDPATCLRAKKKCASILGRVAFVVRRDKPISANVAQQDYLKQFYMMQKAYIESGKAADRPVKPPTATKFQDVEDGGTIPENVRAMPEVRQLAPGLSPLFAGRIGDFDVSTMELLDKWYATHGIIKRETVSQKLQREDPSKYELMLQYIAPDEIQARDMLATLRKPGEIIRDSDGCPVFEQVDAGQFVTLEGPYYLEHPNKGIRDADGNMQHDGKFDKPWHMTSPLQFVVPTSVVLGCNNYHYDHRKHDNLWSLVDARQPAMSIVYDDPYYYPIIDIRQEQKAVACDNAEPADALFDMAEVLEREGKVDEAAALYKKSIKLRPANREHRKDLSMAVGLGSQLSTPKATFKAITAKLLAIGKARAEDVEVILRSPYIYHEVEQRLKYDVLPGDTPITKAPPPPQQGMQSLADVSAALEKYGLTVDDLSEVIPERNRPKLSIKDGSYRAFQMDMQAIADGIKAQDFIMTIDDMSNTVLTAQVQSQYNRAVIEANIGRNIALKYADEQLNKFLQVLAQQMSEAGHGVDDIETATGHAAGTLDVEAASIFNNATRARATLDRYSNDIMDTILVRNALASVGKPYEDDDVRAAYEAGGMEYVPISAHQFAALIRKHGCPQDDDLARVLNITPSDCVGNQDDYDFLIGWMQWARTMYAQLWRPGLQVNKETGQEKLISEHLWVRLPNWIIIKERDKIAMRQERDVSVTTREFDKAKYVIDSISLLEIIKEFGEASINTLVEKLGLSGTAAKQQVGKELAMLIGRRAIMIKDGSGGDPYEFTYELNPNVNLHDDTIELANVTPEDAYKHAAEHGSMDELRTIVCKKPYLAYEYALNIDKGPSDETRTAACKLPYPAYEYALNVDKAPHDETWGACKNLVRYKQNYLDNVPGARERYGNDATGPASPGGTTARLTTRCLLTTRR